MPRVKFYNHKTKQWENADKAYSDPKSCVTSVDGIFPDENGNVEIKAANNEIIDLLVENDMLPGITDADGSILTDENNNILSW